MSESDYYVDDSSDTPKFQTTCLNDSSYLVKFIRQEGSDLTFTVCSKMDVRKTILM